MVQPPVSMAPRPARQTILAPLSILRTETVLSRFPIHHLTKHGRVAIRIRRTNAHGVLEVRWDVSYNEHYGPPRQLAYKLDTIVINQRLDTVARPLLQVLRVGSLCQIGMALDVNASGQQQAELKRAFHQNASAYIVAYLRYRSCDGTERTLNTGFTRYSVVFTGETLPNGTKADAVYLVLSEPYLDLLTHAPVRPLDYAYLKALTPMAQRFYELLSYKMFAALKYHHPHATLRYADYCLLATQQRYSDVAQVQKQMYKIHRPHLQSGYLTQVRYAATTDEEGRPDWLMAYTPGPKAQAEYAAFMRQPGADADQEGLAATRTPARPWMPSSTQPEATGVATLATATTDPEPHGAPLSEATPGTPHPTSRPAEAPALVMPLPAPLPAQAHAQVTAFYQRFHGLTQVTPSPKALTHATEILAIHGEAKAHFLLAFAHQAARETAYAPQTFMGIEHYLPRALAAYDAQAARVTQAATRQAAADERTQREQYQAWEQRELAQLRAARPPEELAALEAEARARLVAVGTPAVALPLAVRVAVDQGLAAQAGLPAFESWRQRQEACG